MVFGLFRRKKKRVAPVTKGKQSKSAHRPNVSQLKIVGVVSAKGGCGKSTIVTNLAVLTAALYKGVVVVDLDLANASVSELLLSTPIATKSISAKDMDGVNVLDALITGDISTILKIEYPPGNAYNIKIHGENAGRMAKNIHILPAKNFAENPVTTTEKMATLSSLDIQTVVKPTMQSIFYTTRDFAQKKNIMHIYYDFPPFPLGMRKSKHYVGVFTALDLIPQFIAVTTPEPSSVRGLVELLSSNYAFITRRLMGVIVNAVHQKDSENVKDIIVYLKRTLGTNVYIIPYTPIWTVRDLPPIILQDPAEPGARELIEAAVDMGLFEREVVCKRINFLCE